MRKSASSKAVVVTCHAADRSPCASPTTATKLGGSKDVMGTVTDASVWLRVKRATRLLIAKVWHLQRFPFWTKLVAVMPIFAWLAAMQAAGVIAPDVKPIIDTTSLPLLETTLTGGVLVQHWPATVLSPNSPLLILLTLYAGLVYFIHFFTSGLFAALLYHYLRNKKRAGRSIFEPWSYFWCFGIMNILGVTTQLVYPTAPPWWVEMNGSASASYATEGDAAGLRNIDNMLGYPMFRNMYGTSPIVFGSFPSLHAAWPFMMFLTAPTMSARLLLGWYAVSVWWAAVFLNHHYIVDIIGGIAYTTFAYFFGRWTIAMLSRRWFPRRYDGKDSHMDALERGGASYGDSLDAAPPSEDKDHHHLPHVPTIEGHVLSQTALLDDVPTDYGSYESETDCTDFYTSDEDWGCVRF